MPLLLLHHRHSADDCAVQVAAESPGQVLALLPRFVAARTDPIEIREVQIP